MQDNEYVTKYLIDKNLTITFMESCTSGLLASMLTDTPGASEVFKGSLVTYSNDIKVASGVSRQIIEKYGVYSTECAREMARKAKESFNADIAVGITGTTGNVDPKNLDSSVAGEVFYCIMSGDNLYDYHIKLDVKNLDRAQIKQHYANDVYKSLRDLFEEI